MVNAVKYNISKKKKKKVLEYNYKEIMKFKYYNIKLYAANIKLYLSTVLEYKNQ